MAEAEATKQKVDLAFVQQDMRCIPFVNTFDAIINIFTSFGYLGTEEEDYKVIQQVSRALKPNGQFLIDIDNRDWLLSVLKPKTCREINGIKRKTKTCFDKANGRTSTTIYYTRNNKQFKRLSDIRRYSFEEMTKMLQSAGLKPKKNYGGFKDEPYSNFSKRMIILSTKTECDENNLHINRCFLTKYNKVVD